MIYYWGGTVIWKGGSVRVEMKQDWPSVASC